jgi:release factor glutamine methyltransferase
MDAPPWVASTGVGAGPYEPMSAVRSARLRAWHDDASAQLHALGAHVTGVDINPHPVAAAEANARRNRVADRTTFVEGDLFDPVDGVFDLVISDPPFRWFRPADLLEVAITDEGYGTLRRFMTRIHRWLAPDGRVLLFFGSSGDLTYLHQLIDGSALSATTLASRDLHKDDLDVTYHTFRLTR